MTAEENLKNLITEAKKIGLVSHKNGDGDAFGSMLALERILREKGKNVVIFSNEPLLSQLDFLKGNIDILFQENFQPVDLLIGLDANSEDRFTDAEIFEKAKKAGAKMAVIDHHLVSNISEKIDVYWHNKNISSTSEMVFDLAQMLDIKIDKVTASLILMGIETDTFSMQNVNTTPKTYEVVADLLRLGARLRPVVESAFGGKPIAVAKILGLAIERLKTDKNGWGITYITLKDKVTLGLGSDPSSGVANFLDQVDKLLVVAVFEEREEGIVKVSLRSNNSDVNVAEVAGKFGGGGHEKAAGFEFHGKLEQAIYKFEKAR